MNVNQASSKFAARLHVLPFCLIVPAIVYLAICGWYDVHQFQVFAGDDLRSIPAAQGGFAAFNDMMISFYKFRPVTALFLSEVARWTNGDFHSVVSVSLALHTLNAFLFCYLLYGCLRLPLLLSVGVSGIAAFNRFGTYLFMQDSALTGGLAVALFLVILIVSSKFMERPTTRSAIGLVLLFAIILHTYEQYLVLAGPLVLLAVFMYRRNRTSALVVGAGVIASLLANFGIKSFILRTPILTGTETRPITMDFGQILSFCWHGALNLIGINSGPTYLSLGDYAEAPAWIKIISVGAAFISLYLIFTAARMATRWREKEMPLLPMAFFACTTAVMLLSASITFRQQYSWLYPAYLSFLAFLAFVVQRQLTRSWAAPLALTLLVLLSIPKEVHLARRHAVFFAFETQQIANNLFATLNAVKGVANYDVIVIRGEVPSPDWVFLDGGFSRLYRLPTLEFASPNAPVGQTDQSRLVLDYTNDDRSFRIAREQQAMATTLGTHQMNFSVLEESAAAFVPSDQWSTPTRTPEFRMSKNGVDCMIEVSPVEVVIPVPHPAATLHFTFSHVYAVGDGADVELAALSASGATDLFSDRVPPLANNDFPIWRKYEFKLPAETEKIRLRVLSKTDSSADWIAVRDFSFD